MLCSEFFNIDNVQYTAGIYYFLEERQNNRGVCCQKITFSREQKKILTLIKN